MYVQTTDDDFVLDPWYESSLGSYSTRGDEIKVLVTNKKDLNQFLMHCFGNRESEFLGKTGAYNQYTVKPTQPIQTFAPSCVRTTDPPPMETTVFSMVLEPDEVAKRSRRNPVLAHWVLAGENPTQFNKLLKKNFDVVPEGVNLLRVTPKKVVPEGVAVETDTETTD
jgi:hypothetical protein